MNDTTLKKLPIFVIYFFLAMIISGLTLCSAQETVNSQIKEVTLFSNLALIKREAITNVNKGLNELLLELQAYSVDKDSVSAKVFGEGEILSIQHKELFLKEPPQENIKVLEQKIKDLNESKRILTDEKDVLNKRVLFLNSLINFSQTQVPQDIKTSFPKTDDLEKTLVFLTSNFESINGKNQSLDHRIEEIDKEIGVLKKELESLKVGRRDKKNHIEVLFNSKKEQTARIEASYLAHNAFWKPLYKVSVPTSLDAVDLVMFANIQQITGEDWKDIALSISNIIPLSGVTLPSLSSWLLDIPRPIQKAVRKDRQLLLQENSFAPSEYEEKASADYEDISKKEAYLTYAQKRELPLSFEYKIPQHVEIESKEKETILPLFTKNIKGEFFYYTVPQTSNLTFLVCKASADKELLSGPLNVNFGGQFIGKTLLSEKRAGEEFYLNLGADREVKVKREKIKDTVKETFFGKIERNTIIKEMAFKITLENLKEKPIKIRLIDSIPVSRSDIIEVKNVKIVPEPLENNYQDQEGVHCWEFRLKPKEKQEINISFLISYPKDRQVIGL